jgi:hypothetical protein
MKKHLNHTIITTLARYVAGVVLLLGLATTSCAQSTRTLSVNITVLGVDGSALQDVPLVMETSVAQAAVGVTGADGHVVLTGEVPLADRIVGVRLSAGGEDGIVPSEQERLLSRMRTLLMEMCFLCDYTVELVPGQSSYSISIAGKACVELSGTVSGDEILEHDIGAISRVFVPRPLDAEKSRFLMRAQRDSMDTAFVIGGNNVLTLSLLPADTAASGELPEITVASVPRNATVSLVLTGGQSLRRAATFHHPPGVTLVSEGGDRIWTFDCRVEGDVRTEPQWILSEPVTVPAGTYYIASGLAVGLPGQRALIDAVRRGDDLTNSGVPKVTAVAGQTVSIEVDLAAAYAACHNLRRP